MSWSPRAERVRRGAWHANMAADVEAARARRCELVDHDHGVVAVGGVVTFDFGPFGVETAKRLAETLRHTTQLEITVAGSS